MIKTNCQNYYDILKLAYEFTRVYCKKNYQNDTVNTVGIDFEFLFNQACAGWPVGGVKT